MQRPDGVRQAEIRRNTRAAISSPPHGAVDCLGRSFWLRLRRGVGPSVGLKIGALSFVLILLHKLDLCGSPSGLEPAPFD